MTQLQGEHTDRTRSSPESPTEGFEEAARWCWMYIMGMMDETIGTKSTIDDHKDSI